jgi:hypothetical protein
MIDNYLIILYFFFADTKQTKNLVEMQSLVFLQFNFIFCNKKGGGIFMCELLLFRLRYNQQNQQ